jgi:hypothetical protein
LPDDKLTFDPKNIKAKARDGTATPPPALPAAPRAAVDLEAKPVEETNAAGAAPDAGKNTGAASDNIVNAEQPTQTTLDFITN